MRRNRWYLPPNHFVKEYQSLVLSPGLLKKCGKINGGQ
jgi:hypothetical protein